MKNLSFSFLLAISSMTPAFALAQSPSSSSATFQSSTSMAPPQASSTSALQPSGGFSNISEIEFIGTFNDSFNNSFNGGVSVGTNNSFGGNFFSTVGSTVGSSVGNTTTTTNTTTSYYHSFNQEVPASIFGGFQRGQNGLYHFVGSIDGFQSNGNGHFHYVGGPGSGGGGGQGFLNGGFLRDPHGAGYVYRGTIGAFHSTPSGLFTYGTSPSSQGHHLVHSAAGNTAGHQSLPLNHSTSHGSALHLPTAPMSALGGLHSHAPQLVPHQTAVPVHHH